MSAPRLLIVQHEDDAPPAWFGNWFRDAGLEYDVVHGDRGDVVPQELGAYAGLVVLGGEMNAYDDATCPWLTSTKTLIASVVGARRCFLGICLGHQLAAVALGGEVITNPLGQTIGLAPVALTEEGRRDYLLTAIAAGAQSIQWNADVVSKLPEAATELATSPDGTVLAARFGRRAWGVQFHPEVSPAVFRGWIDNAPVADPELRGRLEVAMASIMAADAELQRYWEPLARRFADVVVAQLAVS